MIKILVFNEQAEVVTTIGFLKEAPRVNLSGFCVYHKNRLIMVSFEHFKYVTRKKDHHIPGYKLAFCCIFVCTAVPNNTQGKSVLKLLDLSTLMLECRYKGVFIYLAY